MTPIVVDASVAAKWLLQEDGSERAECLLQERDRLVAPALLLTEVADVMVTKVRRGEAAADQPGAALTLLRRTIPTFVPEHDLIDRATAMALDLKHPVYDCLYLACTEILGGRMVTADRKLGARVADGAFATLVIHLDELSRATLLALPDLIYDELVRLGGNHVDTKVNLSESSVSFADIAGTESLNGWRLAELLARMTADERAEALAVALLGRGTDGTHWPSLHAHARLLCDDVAYLVRALQPHAVLAGLTALRTMPI